MTPILCSSKEVGGWTSVYYLCGGLGIVWVLFWSIFASNYADNNRWISQKEQDYILDVVNLKKRKEQYLFPWCEAFHSLPFYAILLGRVTFITQQQVIISYNSTFNRDVLKLNLDHLTERALYCLTSLG
ncbi:hypothetical protein L596_020697 [Steinernema carpocapsae]|uniref:Major facilitator superfamily (MFS) profile domain-containing protein n=1 Tax=Steinernema carpocapsae TaxID=34508 RepID=A0A4U5MUI4_STECR|nr:hypothetical protein L596_020697 [Steinernema carpocapsae]